MEALQDGGDICEQFHKLEIACIGFDNFVNNDDEHYLKALESLRKLVTQIQRESIFSPNEEIKEIQTEHLKLLMAPYYEADVLFRIMDKRDERVNMAHVFFLEYLKMLNHYGVLEKDQAKALKKIFKSHKVSAIRSRKDASIEEIKEAEELFSEIQALKQNPYEDRESKIAEFKLKKMIQSQMDQLKDYKDEEMKREFYMMQLRISVMDVFEKLRMVEMEMQILKHRATLSPEQIEANKARSQKPEPGSLPPLQMEVITKESLNEMPYLMRPQNEFDDQPLTGVVQQYQDPYQRVEIHQETIDQQVDLRQQYQNQVFKPGHNMPTKSLDELAQEEYADAMMRQEQEQAADMIRQNEDPESEEVLERERLKTMSLEDWKDFVPKGRGVTKHV